MEHYQVLEPGLAASPRKQHPEVTNNRGPVPFWWSLSLALRPSLINLEVELLLLRFCLSSVHASALMKFTFFGHAAFLVETLGSRIILDPYKSPDSGGYAPINEPADLVIVSHINDRYHSHTGQILPPFQTYNGLEFSAEGVEAKGIHFEAVPVYETPERLAGDEVTILHFRAEGLHVVHLGDLGHLLTPEELAHIQGADIVLCPAGGKPTLDLADCPAVLQAISPKVVIPMHYKTPRINLAIETRERFLEAMAPLMWEVEMTGGTSLESNRENLPNATRIVCLEPCR